MTMRAKMMTSLGLKTRVSETGALSMTWRGRDKESDSARCQTPHTKQLLSVWWGNRPPYLLNKPEKSLASLRTQAIQLQED
jgi:hypothetical protein